jgi:peptidoglycan/LPS O-acetylase OafA/YrhL
MKTPSESGGRYQSLDVIRGIVCVLVILEHAGVALWTGWEHDSAVATWLRQAIVSVLQLNLGTPLFFVISGYCIASSLESCRRKGTTPATFLAKRLWRIFPPYWSALLGFVAFVVVLDALGLTRFHRSQMALELAAPANLTVAQWLGNITLTETWRPLLGGAEVAVYTRIAWALCYQEQFYLVCFLVLVFAPKRLFGALAVTTLIVTGYRVLIWDSGGLFRIDGTFPVRWHEFAVGLALYWRLNVAKTPVERRAVEAGLMALMAVGFRTGFVSTTAASGFGLILIGLHRWDARIADLRPLTPIQACGRRSYAIYLTHLPVCAIGNPALAGLGLSSFWARAGVMVPVVTLAAIGVGWVFHHWVDRRFTRLPAIRPGFSNSPLFGRPKSVAASLVARTWS